MALTSTGLETQTYQEILDEIITSQKANISNSINVDEDTLLGQLNMIYAARNALVNEAVQDVYDQRDIYKAEGKALDDAVSWLGLVRQSAVPTQGEQYFVGKDGAIIAAGSIVQNEDTQDNFILPSAVTISRSAARSITISVATVSNSTAYTVNVQGVNYTYTTDSSATKQEIVTNLCSTITASANYTATDNGNETFTIVSDDDTDFIFVNDLKLKIDSVTTAGTVICTQTGTVFAPANSVEKILTPTANWTATYNPSQLTTGRDRETDAELRLRAVLARSTSGKATVDSIRSAVLGVDGVSSIAVNEQYVSDLASTAVITVDTVVDNTLYTVTINGNAHTYTSDGTALDTEIAAGLVASIIATDYGYTAVDNADGTFDVVATLAYKMDITVGANLELTTDSQPAGSIQLTIAGGTVANEVAQAIWDSKPAGVEVWAYPDTSIESGTATDASGNNHTIEWNAPTPVPMTVTVNYYVFDTTSYPATDAEAYDAIKAAVVGFGNSLGAGEDVTPSEFEGSVYGAVGGIYRVFIEITDGVDTEDSSTNNSIAVPANSEAYFTLGTTTVTKLT